VPLPGRPYPALWLNLFGDVATGRFGAGAARPDDTRTLWDAGAGLALRGMLYDRPVAVRVDLPVVASDPEVAVAGREGRVRARVVFSVSDLW
jgi:hypothetical protein